MISLKNKLLNLKKQVRRTWLFWGFWKVKISNQEQLDRNLIYNLAPRKVPTGDQLKHLNKFLNPKEYLVVKICLLLIFINLVYLGIVFIGKHLQYSPISGGEYTEGVIGYPKTINPLYATSRDVDDDLSRLIYSSLFKYDPHGNLINDLADNLVIENGGKEYIIQIKTHVKWHNGENLTIDDVLFTFNLIKNQEYRSPLRFSFTEVNIEKVDEQTVKFILSEPYAPFLELLTFGILPKSIWENTNPAFFSLSDLNLKPIGSGPYKFKSLTKNKSGDLKEYHLVLNADYYGQMPYIDNVNFKFFVNYPEAIRALNSNQINGLSYLPLNDKQELLAQNSLSFNELALPQIIAIFFNREKNKTLADKDVRVALSLALNKDEIIQEIFQGAHKRLDGPILENSFVYNSDIKKYDYSPAEATATISSKPLSLVLTVIDSGSNVAVAEKIKNYWEQVGAKIELKIVSGEQALEIIKRRNFEALLYGESIGGDPDVYAFWHSTQISSKGLNLASYNNSEVDKLLAEARVATDLNERISKYQKIQEIITSEIPAIFLYSPTYTYVQSKKIKGFSGTMIIDPADRFSGIADWYVKTKKKLTW